MSIYREQLQCDFCAHRVIPENSRSWDWFTGFRKHTFHACGDCLATRRQEFDALLQQSRVNPKEARHA